MEIRTKRWKCFNRCRRCYTCLGACTFCGYVEEKQQSCCCCRCCNNQRCNCCRCQRCCCR